MRKFSFFAVQGCVRGAVGLLHSSKFVGAYPLRTPQRFFLLSVTALTPRLPMSYKSSDTSKDMCQRDLHSAALLTKDAFIQRLYGFSRTNFDISQSEAARVQLEELLQHRIGSMSPKALHEHMHLGYVAGLHSLCTRIFYQSIQHESQLFMLSEYVVDSAYALQSLTDLVQMASYCVSKVEKRSGPTGRELLAEFLLMRIFWRLTCLFEYAQEEESRGVLGSTSVSQCTEAAEKVFKFVASSFPHRSGAETILFPFFFRLTQRLIKYDTSKDDAEMMFYRECTTRGFLQPPGEQSGDKGTPRLQAKTIPMLASTISEVELFYATLLGTCITGRHVSTAIGYYEQLLQTISTEEKDLLKRDSPHISEFVTYRLLSVLQSNKENYAITQIARRLIAEGFPISISVWSILLVSAGETRAGDVSLHAYQTALIQLESGSTISDKRGLEYLLQTALNALSKCQIPSFEHNYLQASRETGVLHCTDEFFVSCLLQEAHNSMNPVERARELYDRVQREGIPLTARLISRFLKIYLRAEVAEYFLLYRHATSALDLFRRPWLDGLLLWADRRRYSLTQGERKYILKEIHDRLGPIAKEHISGLRTQCALLEYDCTVQSCKYFLKHGIPPNEEPRVQDPRAHFLVRRPSNVLRGVHCCAGSDMVLGEPPKRAVAARVSYLSSCSVGLNKDPGDTDMEAFRVFLADILSTLQRNNNHVC